MRKLFIVVATVILAGSVAGCSTESESAAESTSTDQTLPRVEQVTAPPATTSTRRPRLKLVVGRYCAIMYAAGWSYDRALAYYEGHGRPAHGCRRRRHPLRNGEPGGGRGLCPARRLRSAAVAKLRSSTYLPYPWPYSRRQHRPRLADEPRSRMSRLHRPTNSSPTRLRRVIRTTATETALRASTVARTEGSPTAVGAVTPCVHACPA